MKNKLPSKILLPYFALILAAIIWAVAAPVIKLTLEFVPVFTFLFYRFLLVGLLVLPFLYLELKRNPIDIRDLPNFFILAIASQGSLIFIFLGLKYTTALDTALIGVIGPLLIIGAGHYFYNDRVNKKVELGIILATLGTLVVIVEPALTANMSSQPVINRILGNVLVLIYQFSWPVYIILGKRMMGKDSKNVSKAFRFLHMTKLHKKYNATVLTGISFYIGLALFSVLALVETYTVGYKAVLNTVSISGIIYMAVLSSIVAYGLFQWAIKYVKTSETAIFTYLGPIFTLPAAYLMLGEVPTQAMLGGAVIIASGIIIAEKYKS